MEIQTYIKKQMKITMALTGPSGSGKTYSALLLALGLCGDFSKVVLIDTEDKSGSLYSHLGHFSSVQLGPPFHPSRYYEAVDLCSQANKEVIIIDSLSPAWIGNGGVVDRLTKPHYEDALRAHRALISSLRQTGSHVICTIRSKQKLAWVERDGKKRLELIHLPIQQEGIEYAFETVLSLDNRHIASVVKDRTEIFSNRNSSRLNEQHGDMIKNWCIKGEPIIPDDLQFKINNCKTVSQLHILLSQSDLDDMELISAFTKRRLELEQDEDIPKLGRIPGGLL